MWKSGLFGCFSNCSLCLLATYVAPLAIGKNAEAVGENSPVLWVIAVNTAPCIAGALLRGKIREKFAGENASFWNDCLTWMCCPLCAMVQETVETGSIDYLMPPEFKKIERDVGPSS